MKPKTKTEKKIVALLAAALRKLPAKVKCPKCKRARTKDHFGLRVMARDARGLPTKIARQSYCKECRG